MDLRSLPTQTMLELWDLEEQLHGRKGWRSKSQGLSFSPRQNQDGISNPFLTHQPIFGSFRSLQRAQPDLPHAGNSTWETKQSSKGFPRVLSCDLAFLQPQGSSCWSCPSFSLCLTLFPAPSPGIPARESHPGFVVPSSQHPAWLLSQILQEK